MNNALRSIHRVIPREKKLKENIIIKNWKIIRGDEVMIINGKDQGQVGTVVRVNRKLNTLVVADKNMVWKHVPQTEDNKTGKIRKEMPIHYSNVMLVDPNTKQPCKVEIKKALDQKSGKIKNQRFVKGTEVMIPRPKFTEYMNERVDGPYDTMPEVVTEETYTCNLDQDPIPKEVIDELRSVKSEYKYDLENIKRKIGQMKFVRKALKLPRENKPPKFTYL